MLTMFPYFPVSQKLAKSTICSGDLKPTQYKPKFPRHDKLLVLGITGSNYRLISLDGVHSEFGELVVEVVLVADGKCNSLALVLELLGHLHYPGMRRKGLLGTQEGF